MKLYVKYTSEDCSAIRSSKYHYIQGVRIGPSKLRGGVGVGVYKIGGGFLLTIGPLSRQEKEHKVCFFGPKTARWGGGLPHEGGMVQKVCSLPRKFVFLWVRGKEPEMSGNLARMS